MEVLVTSPTAILAKEIGFKPLNPSTDYVKGFTEQWDEVTDTITGYAENEIQEEDYVREGYYLRPTQTGLQTWLRTKHSTHVNPILISFPDFYRVTIAIYGKFTVTLTNDSDNMCWNSFEEALEFGLYESLKLIP
jgi:hypothetical protein